MRDVGLSAKVAGSNSNSTFKAGKAPYIFCCVLLLVFLAIGFSGGGGVQAQSPQPSMLHPNLAVRPVTSGFITPIALAFLANNDMFVIEKNTGQVKRVVNGVVQSTVLDLAVNNNSERGLLGIALHPNFATNGWVYLYWTCQGTPPPARESFLPRGD